MRVNVDESGHHVLTGGVDHSRGSGALELADGRDAPVQDPDIGGEPRIAGAVHDTAVQNQQVKASWLLCDRNGDGGRENEYDE